VAQQLEGITKMKVGAGGGGCWGGGGVGVGCESFDSMLASAPQPRHSFQPKSEPPHPEIDLDPPETLTQKKPTPGDRLQLPQLRHPH